MTDTKAAYCGGVYRDGDVRIMDRAGSKRLPIGDDGFESLAPRSIFVDKSMLAADLLNGNYKITLFCRPRRFGKTLAMTMLKSFFELPPDGVSRAPLFEGLAIWDAEGGRYQAEQGVRPVIYLSLNDVKKGSWEECYGAFQEKMAVEYRRHSYILDGDALDKTERGSFTHIMAMQASKTELATSLRQLAFYLFKHHGRRVAILIDEYDAPIMAAHDRGYYRQAVDFVKGWLTGALKDGGAALDFACLTGVQRIAKESIFSDLNNIAVDTPLDTESDERFGFTDAEVATLASYLGYPHKRDEVRDWYDGYRFGDADIYNPWSVLYYFSKRCRPGVYWANTASNVAVGMAVRATDGEGLRDIYQLLQPGGAIWRPLDMGVVFPESGLSGDALWSMLYLAGYLTTEDTGSPDDQYLLRRLRIPNREIARVFRGEVIERFRDMAGGSERLRQLHLALVAGDALALQAEIERVLSGSPSCRDLISENSYHMLLVGLLFGVPGYGNPLSNREQGGGYYDLRLAPEPYSGQPLYADLPVITVEFKALAGKDAPTDAAALAEKLARLADEGLEQIDRKDYDADEPGAKRLRYGIAFSGKHVAVACEVGCEVG